MRHLFVVDSLDKRIQNEKELIHLASAGGGGGYFVFVWRVESINLTLFGYSGYYEIGTIPLLVPTFPTTVVTRNTCCVSLNKIFLFSNDAVCPRTTPTAFRFLDGVLV